MAQENILQLIGNEYNSDKIKFLYDKLGKDAFAGQTVNSGDMTVAGWITYLAIKKDGADTTAWKDIVNANFLDEKNNKGQNLFLQMLLAFVNDDNVTGEKIVDFFTDNLSDDSIIKDWLIEPDSQKITAAHVICNEKKYGVDSASIWSAYKDSFNDKNFDENILRPCALAIINNFNDMSFLKDIEFDDFPVAMSTPTANSIIQAISNLSNLKLIEYLNDTNSLLNKIYTSLPIPTGNICAGIDASSIQGLRVEEINFNYSNYAATCTLNYIHPDFYIVAKLKGDLKKLTIELKCPKEITPVIGDNKSSEGYNWLMLLLPGLRIDVNSGDWSTDDYCAIVKEKIGEFPVCEDASSNFSKFLQANAYYGSVKQLSNNMSNNMLSPVNKVLDEINKYHQKWCSDNNKDFEDFKDKYNSLIAPFGSWVDFDNCYKYWCQTYGRMF